MPHTHLYTYNEARLMDTPDLGTQCWFPMVPVPGNADQAPLYLCKTQTMTREPTLSMKVGRSRGKVKRNVSFGGKAYGWISGNEKIKNSAADASKCRSLQQDRGVPDQHSSYHRKNYPARRDVRDYRLRAPTETMTDFHGLGLERTSVVAHEYHCIYE